MKVWEYKRQNDALHDIRFIDHSSVSDTDDAVRQKNKISTYIKDKDVSNSSSYIFGSSPLSIISFIVYCFFNVIMWL